MNLLIIDDEPLVRRSLHRVLQSEGWNIHEAQDGSEGLKEWVRLEPDLVLLDVLMPGLSGPQVLEQLPEPLRRKTKVVMMSAFTGEWSQSKTEELGVNAFIPKPFEDIFAIAQQIKGIIGTV